jgi:hypothetical protein
MKITACQKRKICVDAENITEFHDSYPGSIIIEINGKHADQVCEECEKAISNGDQCFQWNEDFFTCIECGGAGPDHDPIVLDTTGFLS